MQVLRVITVASVFLVAVGAVQAQQRAPANPEQECADLDEAFDNLLKAAMLDPNDKTTLNLMTEVLSRQIDVLSNRCDDLDRSGNKNSVERTLVGQNLLRAKSRLQTLLREKSLDYCDPPSVNRSPFG